MERGDLRRWAFETGLAFEAGGRVGLVEPGQAAAAKALLETDGRGAIAGKGWLALATGGTGGVLKLALHDEETLGAAVTGFCQNFGLPVVNVIDVLPAYHVSGFMARVRARATGGTWLPWDWKRLEAGDFPDLPPSTAGWVLSLVPTQLQRLLDRGPKAEAWLRQLKVIFLGGGPAWPGLLERAREARLPLAPCYGMTETAAMVAALRPEEFLAGRGGVGRAMPHATIVVSEGRARIEGLSLFRGYAGQPPRADAYSPDDLVETDGDGFLTILGRTDDVVITGGRKVSASRLEALLKTALGIGDLVVVGLPDEEWGQRLVACVPKGRVPSPNALGGLADVLNAYELPKAWREISPWPGKDQGKVDRKALMAALEAQEQR